MTPGERRQVWRRENEYGVRGLDQLAPVDERPLERFDALVCRVLHRGRWQAGIDRYFGHGIAIDFTCYFCGRRWYTYDYEHLQNYLTRRNREATQ